MSNRNKKLIQDSPILKTDTQNPTIVTNADNKKTAVQIYIKIKY